MDSRRSSRPPHPRPPGAGGYPALHSPSPANTFRSGYPPAWAAASRPKLTDLRVGLESRGLRWFRPRPPGAGGYPALHSPSPANTFRSGYPPAWAAASRPKLADLRTGGGVVACCCFHPWPAGGETLIRSIRAGVCGGWVSHRRRRPAPHREAPNQAQPEWVEPASDHLRNHQYHGPVSGRWRLMRAKKTGSGGDPPAPGGTPTAAMPTRRECAPTRLAVESWAAGSGRGRRGGR